MATRLVAVSAASMLLFACQAMPSLVKPRLEEEGRVSVYLQSLSQEADRLTFRLEGISAVRGDGTTVPLSLHIGEIRGKDPKRERLLASGELPPGQYLGLSFRVAGATLKGEEGDVALSPAEENPMTSIHFAIARKKALVVSLKFRYRESLPGGIRFAPSFSAEVPGKLATGLIGLVTSRRANTVTVFDKVTGKAVAVVPTGTSPAGMVLDPLSRRAYVAISGEDAVETIDLLGMDVINRGRLVIGDRPEELALTPDRKTLLSANTGSNTVSVVDAASLVETRRIQVGNGPQSILVDRAGRRAYVFNTLSNTISVLDIGTGGVVATVATEAGPVRGEFNRGGNRLYVLHRYSPHLSVFDPTTLSIVRRVYVGSGGTALKVDTRTDLIYLSRQGAGEIAIYDPLSFLPVDSYRTGGDVSFLTIDGEGNNLLVVLPGANGVRTLRLVGKETASETDVGEDPYWVTLMGER
ncbi:MAG: 40-residue YVTN family beta-propeller repeat protein [Actinobacteria bacterium]|nr:40-residue YVTN family beta-propeller repeat protein [Actinomycetota bacterium]